MNLSFYTPIHASFGQEVERKLSNLLTKIAQMLEFSAWARADNNPMRRRLHRLRHSADDPSRTHSQYFGYFQQLHHIDPALAAFVFGDEGLGPAEFFGQLRLGQPGALSRCNKVLAQHLIGTGMDLFSHGCART